MDLLEDRDQDTSDFQISGLLTHRSRIFSLFQGRISMCKVIDTMAYPMVIQKYTFGTRADTADSSSTPHRGGTLYSYMYAAIRHFTVHQAT